jgi:SLT domain-containing protein
MGFGLAVYYGWWLVRFYPGLRIGDAGKGRQVLPEARKREKVGKPVVATAREVIGKPDQAGTTEGSQLSNYLLFLLLVPPYSF